MYLLVRRVIFTHLKTTKKNWPGYKKPDDNSLLLLNTFFLKSSRLVTSTHHLNERNGQFNEAFQPLYMPCVCYTGSKQIIMRGDNKDMLARSGIISCWVFSKRIRRDNNYMHYSYLKWRYVCKFLMRRKRFGFFTEKKRT